MVSRTIRTMVIGFTVNGEVKTKELFNATIAMAERTAGLLEEAGAKNVTISEKDVKYSLPLEVFCEMCVKYAREEKGE